MTMDVVAAFQDGRQEEALAGAVAFSAAPGVKELGETHPTYINALATVAALVSQMGAPEQAAELLQEAEDLQEEVEMEALERSDVADGAFLTSLGGDGGGSSGSSSVGAGGGTPSAGSDGDVEGGPGQSSLDEEEEAARGLEALTITKLTWTVNSLLKDGRPEEAAKALSESERFLLSGSGRGAVGVVARAALHTLWAAVLDSIGEKDKARRLYSEARGAKMIHCVELPICASICVDLSAVSV
ncbi:unnamed protein product [Prorocentrum cordatum]|uniref:KIF-binding protein n=1 Tax=Prorocentrum cordatum TaxID=2364126 RepID=A0ABN9WMF1_9DINO|nr:unnamed protein product [Polarella glacialis]